MMKFTQVMLSAVLIVALVSCSSGGEESSLVQADLDQFTTYAIDVEGASTPIFDLLKEVDVIQLEETDSSLLGTVSMVVRHNGQYIFRSSDLEKYYVYSEDGKFINSINRAGNGPEEYKGVMDYWMDNGALVIYSRTQTKMIAYDLEGNYIWSKKVPMMANHAQSSSAGIMLDMNRASFADSLNYNLALLNEDMKVTKSFLPFNKEERFTMLSEAPSLVPYNEQLVYNPQLSDSVFIVKGDSVEPLIHFDFGEDWLWNDRLLLTSGQKAFDAIENIKKPWNVISKVGPRHIFLLYAMGFEPFPYILIDRETGEVTPLKISQKSQERYTINIIKWEGDRLLCSLPSTEISEFVGRLPADSWKLRSGSDMESIENSENPVLLWLSFK